ncbi:MAG: multidrug effflux MFS transporter [Syntrophorhabdales bacterium]|jgi:DHA1 family bicyclomycin/chloramphenicol resistance-like MFS transporter
MDRSRHTVVIVLLGGLSALGPFAIDTYLPGFLVIARDLKTDVAHVGFTLTSYILGVAVGQLVYGPILDRWGRKKPLVIGTAIFSAAAIGCALAPSINWLITLRLFLALGGSVGLVGSRAIIRDLFSGRDIARALSMLMMVFGVAPVIAPTMGGLLVAAFGWRSVFAVLAGISVLMVVAVKHYLYESKGCDPSVSLRPKHVLVSYIAVFKEREFTLYALAAAATSGALFSYLTGAPFLYGHLFGFTVSQTGWLIGMNACALIAANQVNRMALRRYGSSRVLVTATSVQATTGLLLLAGALSGFLPRTATLGLIVCYLFCFGFVFPNAIALALQPFSRNAGSASALVGSIQMGAGALASWSVSYFHNGTPVPMILTMTVSAVVSLVLFVWGALPPRVDNGQPVPDPPSRIVKRLVGPEKSG